MYLNASNFIEKRLGCDNRKNNNSFNMFCFCTNVFALFSSSGAYYI